MNGTPGGVITPQMSPSKGQTPDDVDAKLTVGEFVMPLDVVRFKGKEYFYKQIDSARKQEMMQNSRGDIGGEPVLGIPSRNPQFVSRPNTMPQQAMPAAMPAAMSAGIPARGFQQGGPADNIPPMPPSNITGPEWEAQFKAHNDAFDKKWNLPPTVYPSGKTHTVFLSSASTRYATGVPSLNSYSDEVKGDVYLTINSEQLKWQWDRILVRSQGGLLNPS